MKGLVVFYSRTGATKQAAEYLAERLGYDIGEIEDLTDRRGAMGYLSGGHDALYAKLTEIREPRNEPDKYDTIIIGTPVWGLNITPAVRAYIENNRLYFPEVAFFCVEGSMGAKRALKEMQALCAKLPKGVCELTTREVQHGTYIQKLERFIEKINPAAVTPA